MEESKDLTEIVQALRLDLSFQEQALTAVLLFHDSTPWDTLKKALWRELTGTNEATTKVLCTTVRQALAKGGYAYGGH